MTGFWKRGDGLERELRATRPQAPADLVSRLEGRLSKAAPASRRPVRAALPAAFTAVVLGGLAAVGGVSYAASSVTSAVKTVSHVFAPASTKRVVVVQGLTAGGDEYKPGYGWGDPNHVHTGPPGLTEGNGNGGDNGNGGSGAFAPPLTASVVGPTAFVSTSFKLDEQAHLYLSVIDQNGNELLITQTKSKANGSKLTGVQAKNVNYMVLVPRTIPLKVAIPANLLASGNTYSIRIIAVSPTGDKTTLKIPFKS